MEKSKEKVVECEERPIRNKGKEKIYETINSPHMENGKEKVVESEGRPVRNRRPTIKGYGLYTNMKTGQQTFYSGQGKGIHISSSVEPKKMKASNDPVGTPESIIKKKK
ncbi:hypothetical protein PTKIN_Ptkin01aG0000700 [Pterospermum kingtungense]